MKRLNEQNINTPKLFNDKFDGKLGVSDMERFEKLAHYFDGGVYVDIGSWDSPMPALLAERFPHAKIYALDFADKVISAFKGKFKAEYVQIESCYKLPFEKESVDYIVGGEIIEHLEEPKKFIEECLRVLNPGGILAVSTPHIEIEKHHKIGGPTHLWSYDEEDLKDLGFTEIKTLQEGDNLTWLAWQKKSEV